MAGRDANIRLDTRIMSCSVILPAITKYAVKLICEYQQYLSRPQLIKASTIIKDILPQNEKFLKFFFLMLTI